jgi:glycosyltransferase involved in cell wall biosynthesis
MPSLWYENYPISAAIAVAAGVPVIASDSGGARELIDSFQCGFTFLLGDPEDLAGLLDRLLDDVDVLKERRRMMRFPPGVEEEAWAMEQVYLRASNGPALS